MNSEKYICLYQDLFDNDLWKSYTVVGNKYYFNDIGTQSIDGQIGIMVEIDD